MLCLRRVQKPTDKDRYFASAKENWNVVETAYIKPLNGLARMNARYEFGASEKYETRRSGHLSGSQTLASKGRGRAAPTHGSGRLALATSSCELTQTAMARWDRVGFFDMEGRVAGHGRRARTGRRGM